MWKIHRVTTNLFIQLTLTSLFTILLWDTALGLSDKRLCADEKCKEIISFGRGKITYYAGEEGMISFNINAPIRIKSKSAGSDPTLWGIEVNGREGYAPLKFIKEDRVLIKNLKFEVDVVKPGSQMQAIEPHVLSSSESTVEATTTKPLDAVAAESITSKPVENASAEQPEMATPVQQASIVDGTRIPTFPNDFVEDVHEKQRQPSSGMENDNEIDDEDADDEIGDYDDEDDEEDDDEVDSKENPSTNTMAKQPSTTSAKTDTNSINSQALSKENLTNTAEVATETKTPFGYEQADGTNASTSVKSTTTTPVKEGQLPQAQVLNEATELPMPTVAVETTTEAVPVSLPPTPFSKSPEHSQTAGEAVNNTNDLNTVEKTPQHQEVPIADLKASPDVVKHENVTSEASETTANENEQNLNISSEKSLPDNSIKNAAITSEEKFLSVDSTETNQNSRENLVGDPKPAQSELPPTESTTKQPSSNVDSAVKTQGFGEQLESDNRQPMANISVQNDGPANIPVQNDGPATVLATQQPPSHANSSESNQDTNEVRVSDTPNQMSPHPEKATEQQPPHVNSAKLYQDSNEQLVSDTPQQMSSHPAKELPTEQPPSHILETTSQTQPSSESPNYQYSVSTHPDNAQINTETVVKQQSAAQAEINATEKPQIETETLIPSAQYDPYHQTSNEYATPTPYNPYDYDESSNTPLPPQYEYNNNPTDLPQTNTPAHYDNYGQQPTGYAPPAEESAETTMNQQQHISPSDTPMDRQSEVTTARPQLIPSDTYYNQPSFGQGSVEPLHPAVTPEPPKMEEEPKALPSLTPPVSTDVEKIDNNKGLFATIMDTVNNILPNNKKSKHATDQDELNRILYPDVDDGHKVSISKEEEERLFCEKMGPNECPYGKSPPQDSTSECVCSLKSLITTEFTLDSFAQALAAKVLEISELLAFLTIVAAATLFFIFGYYCFCNSSSEGALLSKLNQLESSLLATHKENAILKHNLMSTRQKLVSIEDNSFGSNDMVVSIKKELEEELVEKARLQEQITTLQKELENAADAGIELNKIVSELLSNQTGDESIISSVEELQKQLNEQQNTILEINASLAEKSRENSELQLLIAEQNARYESEISNLQRDNDELEAEKGNLQTRLEEIKTDFDKDITAALEGKNFEIKRLQNEIVDWTTKVDAEHTKWQTSMAKVEALEECLKKVKRDPSVNITQVIDVANTRAELLDAQRKYTSLKERLELELDARKLSEIQLHLNTAEVEKLKQAFNQSEKDKLEAQTRLEVLSNYFKDKENQLQKELSLKETMWLKQQGETTTTVDRLTTMQEEIQSLKSQNDALRAEIEAQVAAHKAQTGTLENRAHETWLAARQSDRRCEEARAEATALRRKLTVLAGGNVNEAIKPSAGPAGLGDDLTNAPSPIHMESPGSPMLGRMPPPPFLPPPFMGPPPPFMGMPPPPFVPPGEMRPAPLGRIMSPPPPQRSGHLDYEDYLDYEGNNSWHRHHTYSPPPRTYRSLSPTDSRYNYGPERDLMSTYDTETDFSPPPSPRESRRRGGGGGYGSDKDGGGSNPRNPYNNSKKSSAGIKGNISSGSDKSYNSSSKHGNKSKSSGGGGGKSLV